MFVYKIQFVTNGAKYKFIILNTFLDCKLRVPVSTMQTLPCLLRTLKPSEGSQAPQNLHLRIYL